jgi:hypothetical protein
VLSTIVRLLIALALAAGLLPLAWEVLAWALRGVRWPPPDVWAVSSGGAAGVGLMLWRRPNWFLHTAIHELCHLVACCLLLVRPTGISITDGRGGAVEHLQTGPIRSTLIAIAPYTLPLLLAPALGARHLLADDPGPWRTALSALSAFLAVTHLHALYHNIRINITGDQSDLVRVGRPLSAVLIAIALMLIAAWTLVALWSGPGAGHALLPARIP